MGGVDAIVEKLPEIVRQQIPQGAGVFESRPHINESWHTFSTLLFQNNFYVMVEKLPEIVRQ